MSKPIAEFGVVHRRSCHFTGRVQGVGFRYTTKNIAMRYNVAGYVRNLPDGRVELVVEGPDEEMQRVIEEVKEKMADYVHRVDEAAGPASGEFAYFSIRHC